MSALTDESARRFCETIGIKGGALKKPEPIAVPKSEPVASPQAHIETKQPTKPDKNNFSKRMDDELDAQVEFERRPDLFDDSEGGWENVQLVLDFIKEHHDGYPSRATVQDAITTLLRQGELLTLFRPEPEKAPPTTSQPPAPAKPVAPIPPPDPDEGLPPLPPYVVRALGNNPLRTRKDVHAIPSWLYSEIYRGPHQSAFKARVNAVMSRR